MTLGLLMLALGCGSSHTPTTPTPSSTSTPSTGNPVVDQMLAGLGAEIVSALAANRDNLPRNPGSAAQIDAKIALLQQPALASQIVVGGFYATATADSMNGRAITLAAVFPAASMRADASTALQQLATALPILEQFMATPFPSDAVRVWYGFVVGSSDRTGSATIDVEDRATYESRTAATRLPAEAILDHELSHNYIGHEGLNQFLEMYQYNVVHTGSTNPAVWTYVRMNPGPPPDAVASAVALLDVYRLIGHDAMAKAYRAIYPLKPPYGQLLPSNLKQQFIDVASADAKAQVTALMANVGY